MAKSIDELLAKVAEKVGKEQLDPDGGCQCRLDGWLCSREDGHAGDHIAVAGPIICCIWKQGYGSFDEDEDDKEMKWDIKE
jgi:hypothetical protein